MRTTACGPQVHHIAGRTYDLPEDQAQAYLDGGFAVAASPAAARAPEAEFTTLPVEELADARPRGRKR